MKLLIIQSSPASRHFLPLRSKCPLQHSSQTPSICVLPLVWETKFHTQTKQQVKLKLEQMLLALHEGRGDARRWPRLMTMRFLALWSAGQINVPQATPCNSNRTTWALTVSGNIWRVHAASSHSHELIDQWRLVVILSCVLGLLCSLHEMNEGEVMTVRV
jgi:hypothetical protein